VPGSRPAAAADRINDRRYIESFLPRFRRFARIMPFRARAVEQLAEVGVSGPARGIVAGKGKWPR